MEKIFILLALFCLIFSCSKKDEQKTELNSGTTNQVENTKIDSYISDEDEILINSSEPEKVIERLSEKVNSENAELDEYLTYIVALTSEGIKKKITIEDLNKSLEIINKLLEKYPENYELHRLKGLTYDLKGETEEAVQHFSKALEIESKDSYIFSNLGALYRKTGNIEKAKENIKKSLEIDELNHQALMSSAIIDYREGNFDEAVKSLDKLIENYKNKEILINANLLKAKSLTKQEKYEDAEKNYLSAIGLGERAETYLDFGIFNYQIFEKKLEEKDEIKANNYLNFSEELLIKSLELESESIYTNLFLGYINQDKAKNEESEKYYKKALELLEKDQEIEEKRKQELKKEIEENIYSLTI
ncbi:hypothetical protein DLH72_02250 [Candidatus Gracilibacteria bacterium]|nr:MAG: hypothetical protein DLH72_02250 [Candidatus Gracilibacteria bacterium]